MGRNTPILTEIINVLGDRIAGKEASIIQLEKHFSDRLVVDAGDVSTIEAYAKRLRLRITSEECPMVLDYIASKGMVRITIDHVEEAINERFGQDRFIEPAS